MATTTDNKHRVHATMQAYFDFVADDGGAFRLVFESDLTNEPAVRERVERVHPELRRARQRGHRRGHRALPRARRTCSRSASSAAPRCRARYWITQGQPIDRAEAVELVSTLAWRGISPASRDAVTRAGRERDRRAATVSLAAYRGGPHLAGPARSLD